MYDKVARKADLRFYSALGTLQYKVNSVIGGKGEDTNHYKIDPKNITLIEEIENDYKRRQGNLVLGAVKRIKPEIFQTKIKHKVNDRALKRRLAISHRKVGTLLDKFLFSFGGDSELLERDFTSRCKESGVLSEVVSIWAGHSLSGTITTTVYTHYSEEFQLREAEKVDYLKWNFGGK